MRTKPLGQLSLGQFHNCLGEATYHSDVLRIANERCGGCENVITQKNCDIIPPHAANRRPNADVLEALDDHLRDLLERLRRPFPCLGVGQRLHVVEHRRALEREEK